MLKTNDVYFFDLVEFEEIIIHYLDAGKHTLAKKAVKLGLEQHPNSIDLQLLQVEIFIFEDELEKASDLLKIVEFIEPTNEEVWIQKSAIYSKQGLHKNAIECLNKALKYTEDEVEIWNMLGMEYLYIDDFDNARLNFAKCIDVDFEDYSALYNIVYCFDMQEDHEYAIKYLNNYIDTNPYCEVAWHQLGRQYFILNMYKEALTAFDYAVLIDEDFIGGYLEKAKTLEELGRFTEAIANYQITLKLDDPTAFAFVRIAYCYEQLKKYKQAINYYKKAVQEDPLLDKAWVGLTQLFINQKDYEKAAFHINKAIKIDEENAVYWRLYAEINIKQNQFEEAVVGFENCIMLQDASLEVFVGLSDVLLFLGDYADALNILFQAQKLYKDFAEVEYRLAGLFFILNKNKYCRNHLINALKIDFDYHYIIKELFPSIYNKKEIKGLILSFKKATQ